MVREKYSKRCLLLNSGLVEKYETCEWTERVVRESGTTVVDGKLFHYEVESKDCNKENEIQFTDLKKSWQSQTMLE